MEIRFFVEYEFQTKNEKIYWLPVFINGRDKDRASQIATNIKTALSEKFKILRRTDPVMVVQGWNSQFFDDYVNSNLKGKLSILNIHYWELMAVEPQIDLTFDNHLKLIDYYPEKFANRTFAEGENIKLPVKIVSKGISDHKEFLVVDVVKPK